MEANAWQKSKTPCIQGQRQRTVAEQRQKLVCGQSEATPHFRRSPPRGTRGEGWRKGEQRSGISEISKEEVGDGAHGGAQRPYEEQINVLSYFFIRKKKEGFLDSWQIIARAEKLGIQAMMGSLVLAVFRFLKDTRKQIKKYKCHFLQFWHSNNGPRTSFRFWGDNSKFSSSNHLLPFHVFWRREKSQGFWKKRLSLAGWKMLLRNSSQENSSTNCCQSGTTYKMAKGSREGISKRWRGRWRQECCTGCSKIASKLKAVTVRDGDVIILMLLKMRTQPSSSGHAANIFASPDRRAKYIYERENCLISCCPLYKSVLLFVVWK